MAELTTQLLRIIGILCLPLCRINKLGYTYPPRLLRSPTLVGYQPLGLVLPAIEEQVRTNIAIRIADEK